MKHRLTPVGCVQRCLAYTSMMLVATHCVEVCGGESAEQARPNILLCMADDWGWPHAGAYRDRVVKTPTFDRLAREGVLFAHAYVSSPSCTPSRNAVLTGQQFYRLQAGANLWSTLDVREPNFMFVLRDAGYEIGHWRKAWGPGDYTAGGYNRHPCGPNTSFDKFLAERDPAKPFCFWLGTSDPHRGYQKGSGAASGMDIDAVQVPAFFPNTEEVRSDVADYYFEVERWDSDVAQAIALVEEHGVLENTMVVMTGDHGMPFPRCKGNLYDWGSRVPLAVRWGAEVPPEREITDFVSLTDLAPTFLAAAGVEVPAEMTGESLLGVLRSDQSVRVDSERDFVVMGRERHTPAQTHPSMAGYPSRAIRTDNWLLILNLKPDRWPAGVPAGAQHRIETFSDCDDGPTKFAITASRVQPYFDLCFAKRPAVELYDCQRDPDQVSNLAQEPKHAATVERLRKRLVDYLVKTADPRFTDKPVRFEEYPYDKIKEAVRRQ